MTVRSQQLGYSDGVSSGGTVIYTVPSGYRTIVKSIVAANYYSAAQILQVQVIALGVEKAYWTYHLAAHGSEGDSVISDLWVVMLQGEELKATCPNSDVTMIASGAELLL